jgi:DNA-binding IclR family transcriptional regulator
MTEVQVGPATRPLQALEVLALAPRTPRELAVQLNVSVRTARRVLQRLEEMGYAARSSSDASRYCPTLRLVALAGTVLGTSAIVEASLPYIAGLRDDLQLTASLCVPSMLSVLCVAHAAAHVEHGSRPGLRGQRLPSHATASGKTLLAWRDEWRQETLKQTLGRYTDHTLLGKDLELDLHRTRVREHAVELGEYAEQMRAVAAAVFVGGEAVAALSVVGDTQQLVDESLADTGRTVRTAAAALSEDIGPGAR